VTLTRSQRPCITRSAKYRDPVSGFYRSPEVYPLALINSALAASNARSCGEDYNPRAIRFSWLLTSYRDAPSHKIVES
jgi:hypothetical protein